SSTGERMNPYTSMWTGVTEGDGPQEFHLVLMDNGRTAVLADAEGRDALNCIRCSACLNVCPVYERAGGHAYGSTYPGPIGAILTPMLSGIEAAGSLPYASSLCGACYEVCPVKIDIPKVLVHLRSPVVGHRPRRDGTAVGLGVRFEGCGRDCSGSALRVAREEVGGVLAGACRGRGVQSLVGPLALRAAWRPGGVTLVEQDALWAERLDAIDGALTGG